MNLRVSKLKASSKSKSQQAAAVGVACTLERYAYSLAMGDYTGATLRPRRPRPPPLAVAGRRWLGRTLPAARWAVQCPAGRPGPRPGRRRRRAG